MKKEYMTPELMVIACRIPHLMAGSLPKSNSPASSEGTGASDITEGIALGKGGFGGWDDDVEPGEDY